MKYAVVKVPLPTTEQQIQDTISQSQPPGFRLISIAISGGELIMVFGKAARSSRAK